MLINEQRRDTGVLLNHRLRGPYSPDLVAHSTCRLLALLGLGAMSDLSPQCALNRTLTGLAAQLRFTSTCASISGESLIASTPFIRSNRFSGFTELPCGFPLGLLA